MTNVARLPGKTELPHDLFKGHFQWWVTGQLADIRREWWMTFRLRGPERRCDNTRKGEQTSAALLILRYASLSEAWPYSARYSGMSLARKKTYSWAWTRFVSFMLRIHPFYRSTRFSANFDQCFQIFEIVPWCSRKWSIIFISCFGPNLRDLKRTTWRIRPTSPRLWSTPVLVGKPTRFKVREVSSLGNRSGNLVAA